MRKRSIIAGIIFGIASLAGLSIGIRSPFAVGNAFVDENDRVVLHGNVHPKARPEFDAGPTDPSLPMQRTILLLKIAPEKRAELDRLLAEQLDPSSPNFHRWLTPEEFGKRFGRSPEELATVKNWLVSRGFTVEETAKSGTWINFSGTVADVERAFQANMHDYRVGGNLHHANSTDPSIPRALADLVAGPVTLHNFLHKAAHTKPRPMLEKNRQPNYTNPTGSTLYSLAPGDFAVIYDVNNVYSQGYDGTGVAIAVVERTHPANATGPTGKWAIFRSTFGLPPNTVNVIVNGPDPGDLGPDEDAEADLDAEWSGAVAKGAAIDFVVSESTNSSDGSDLSARYIVDNNLAPIMSDCFGTCEQDLGSTWQASYDTLWMQAASQGITVFVVTGDTGAYDCTDNNGNPTGGQAVNGLASTPYNIAVGGTQFNNGSDPSVYWSDTNAPDGASALSYIPELPWNDWAEGYESASGGGASIIYGKPAWQVSPGVPSGNYRYLPDVSLNADDINVGYRVYTCANYYASHCTSNSWWVYGGTSGASPSFAGIMALIVQSAGGEPQGRQGNFNSALYQFGAAQYGGTSGAYAVFHDITSGNNGFGAALPGYSCGVGYDPVTGLGSVDALNLLQAFQEGGTLTAEIDPPGAVSEGATWNVDNGPLQTSGTPVPNLRPGQHTVNFQDTQDWKAPASQNVAISYEQTTTANATYVIKPPVLESFQIDNNATTTSSPVVALYYTATRSPTYYMASQSPTFNGAIWKTCPANPPYFTLFAGNTAKKVYFKVKNAGGESNV
jgi:subtilase family serine protease